MSSRPTSPAPQSPKGGQATKKPFDRRDQSKQQEEQRKQQRTEKNLKDNQKRSQYAGPQDKNKVSKIVSAGQQLVSKFFGGFSSKEHGNVKVELDDNIPERLCSAYVPVFKSYFDIKEWDYEDTDDTAARLYQKFVGATCISLSSKLQKSCPSGDKIINDKFNCLETMKLRLPPKLQQLLNCVGKTDFQDSQIRVYEQSLYVKRFIVKGLFYYFKGELDDYLVDNANFTLDSLQANIFDNGFHGMFDHSLNGLATIRRRSKEYFLSMSERNHVFSFKDSTSAVVKITCRLPSFPFPDKLEDMKINDVYNYLNNNPLFAMEWDTDFGFFIASLLLTCLKLKDLNDVTKSIKKIFTKITWPFQLQDIPLKDVLVKLGFWSLDWYLKPKIIKQLLVEVNSFWNDGEARIVSEFLNLSEFNYSEFGSSAQLIPIPYKDKSGFNKDNIFHVWDHKIKDKPTVHLSIKPPAAEAILGLIGGFTDKVTVSSGFELNYNSEPVSILREFINSDIKR